MADSGPDVLSLREQEAELVMNENISVRNALITPRVGRPVGSARAGYPRRTIPSIGTQGFLAAAHV